MRTKRCDYLEVYLYAKEHGKKAASEVFGLSISRISNALVVGDDILKDRKLPENAKPIDRFTPRELMDELARRGFKGELQYTQIVDITKL